MQGREADSPYGCCSCCRTRSSINAVSHSNVVESVVSPASRRLLQPFFEVLPLLTCFHDALPQHMTERRSNGSVPMRRIEDVSVFAYLVDSVVKPTWDEP